MYSLRRKLFSQNFLYKRKLVKKLVLKSSIGKNDLVLEIGPGKGIITQKLINQAKQVIAVEIDGYWYKYLQNKFINVKNINLYKADILDFQLPSSPYKVFANIPFSIEGKIIRKLIGSYNPPEDCYLVMMKELAYRLCAPYKENMFSVMHKPWFDFSIYHHFERTDFVPVPSVDVVILRFKKQDNPLISRKERKDYQDLVRLGFNQGLPLMKNLKNKFGLKKTSSAFNKIGIRKDIKPSYLSLSQWIKLYSELC
ncbi:23S ribosomal RNA methyltransferase Erm [Candidatus Parcubacteria bacterium]|nr:MAG: 23S ribosomal RNA methyltransferase Erm [Candidatus Parcubacteria bacterium]